MNNEFLIQMVNAMPKDILLKHLKQAIERYQKFPDAETEKELALYSYFLLYKHLIKKRGADTLTKDMNEVEQAIQLMHRADN